MLSEIGSNFWLAPEQAGVMLGQPSFDFGIEGEHKIWLSTARSGISLCLESIEQKSGADFKKIALIPSYTCETVAQPFLKKGYRVYTLPVDISLRTSGEQILAAATECGASVILLHRYFGFESLYDFEDTLKLLRERGVFIIEDRTQCLYSDIKPLEADYYVASIRKWCSVPDGAIAVCKSGRFVNIPKEQDSELCDLKVEAAVLKYRYIIEGLGDKAEFLKKGGEAEELLDSRECAYTISSVSAFVQHTLDVGALKEARQDNYRVLYEGIKGLGSVRVLFEPTQSAVPLYMMLWCKGRNGLQLYLRERSVYAPIIWPRPEELAKVCDKAEELYRNSLCIPIDQRYGTDEMNLIARYITEFDAKITKMDGE